MLPTPTPKHRNVNEDVQNERKIKPSRPKIHSASFVEAVSVLLTKDRVGQNVPSAFSGFMNVRVLNAYFVLPFEA